MSAKDIYSILSSKPHNPHYLKRYIKFIEFCKLKNLTTVTKIMENHHICPKANDMFPEYKSLSENKWNSVKLTPRQHYIAHWMLWKIYKNQSQTCAFWRFNFKQSANKHQYIRKIYSKTYENLKSDKSIYQSILMKELHKTESFKAKSDNARNRNNQIRKESGEQSNLMKTLWETTNFREKQQEYFSSELGKKNIENSIKILSAVMKTPESRARSSKIMTENHKKMVTECPNCKMKITKAFGNYKRHYEKCKLPIQP